MAKNRIRPGNLMTSGDGSRTYKVATVDGVNGTFTTDQVPGAFFLIRDFTRVKRGAGRPSNKSVDPFRALDRFRNVGVGTHNQAINAVIDLIQARAK